MPKTKNAFALRYLAQINNPTEPIIGVSEGFFNIFDESNTRGIKTLYVYSIWCKLWQYFGGGELSPFPETFSPTFEEITVVKIPTVKCEKRVNRHIRRLKRLFETVNKKFSTALREELIQLQTKLQRTSRRIRRYTDIAENLNMFLQALNYLQRQNKSTDSKTLAKAVGLKIREVRQREELSQSQFADRVGLKQSILSNYESGNVEMPLSALRNIAIEFNLSTDELLGIKD